MKVRVIYPNGEERVYKNASSYTKNVADGSLRFYSDNMEVTVKGLPYIIEE